MIDTSKILETKDIGNYYGRLNIVEHDNRFYWCIENYNTEFEDIDDWNEIPESLYREIELHINKTTNEN